MIIRETIRIGDKNITLETGRIAKQAQGSVLVTCGETMVLVTVLVYLLIIALKVSRLDRELGDLARRARERRVETEQDDLEEARVG